MTFTVCLAQLNFVVGDLTGNARRVVEAAATAHAQGAHLLVTPELALCGYAAEDLYLRPGFLDACDDALDQVALGTAGLTGLTVVVGHPARSLSVGAGLRTRSVSVPRLYNAATVLRHGEKLHTYAKQALPNYQLFDERRYFTPGKTPCVCEVPNAGG